MTPPLPSRVAVEHCVGDVTLRDSRAVHIRPIRLDDEPAMSRFHASLSERSTYMRYFQVLPLRHRTEHERLARVCTIDFDLQTALVAERDGEIAGVGRLSRIPNTNDAELAVLVGDSFQSRGLGTEMARRLLQIARDEGFAQLVAIYLPENTAMRTICQRLGMSRVSAVCASPQVAMLSL